MDVSTMGPLENAVERLLQQNVQLKKQRDLLRVEKEAWRQQRQSMLVEIEEVMADLELLREQQS